MIRSALQEVLEVVQIKFHKLSRSKQGQIYVEVPISIAEGEIYVPRIGEVIGWAAGEPTNPQLHQEGRLHQCCWSRSGQSGIILKMMELASESKNFHSLKERCWRSMASRSKQFCALKCVEDPCTSCLDEVLAFEGRLCILKEDLVARSTTKSGSATAPDSHCHCCGPESYKPLLVRQ